MIKVTSIPNGGAAIVLSTRVDVVLFFTALVEAKIGGVGENIVQQLIELLSRCK